MKGKTKILVKQLNESMEDRSHVSWLGVGIDLCTYLGIAKRNSTFLLMFSKLHKSVSIPFLSGLEEY